MEENCPSLRDSDFKTAKDLIRIVDSLLESVNLTAKDLISLFGQAIKYFTSVLNLEIKPLNLKTARDHTRFVNKLVEEGYMYIDPFNVPNFFGSKGNLKSPYRDKEEKAISHFFLLKIKSPDQKSEFLSGIIAFNIYDKGDALINLVETNKKLHKSRLGNLLVLHAILKFLEANEKKNLKELLPIKLDTKTVVNSEEEEELDDGKEEETDDAKAESEGIETPSRTIDTGTYYFYSKLGFRPDLIDPTPWWGGYREGEWQVSF